MDAPRCSYCHDQAVVWIDYPDRAYPVDTHSHEMLTR